MAKAARAAALPLLSGLLDEITIWEILVRVPPKALLRCRVVCRAWRRATSAGDFLVAHHARQPTLPILCSENYENSFSDDDKSLDIILFDNRATDQLQHVARLRDNSYVCASRDGLLILANYHHTIGRRRSICNPATREYALLPQLSQFHLLGMYPHSPTGEYRILVFPRKGENPEPDDACYIFTLGSAQPPRKIGCLQLQELELEQLRLHGLPVPVLVRGGLHWIWGLSNMIMVFNTTAESFRQMCPPTAGTSLFEMDGMLGMSSFTLTTTSIWVLQDYGNEVWTFKCRIGLPIAEFSARCGRHGNLSRVRILSRDGELLILVKFGQWLFQVDMDGELVATFHRKVIYPTQFQLKQTLSPHAFFLKLEGYVVNDFPFASRPDVCILMSVNMYELDPR